jgi:hypothetical protein
MEQFKMASHREALVDVIVRDRNLVRASLDNIPIETLEIEVQTIQERKTAALIKSQNEQHERDKQELAEQKRDAAAEYQRYLIFRDSGLKNTDQNRQKLIQYFPVTDFYSFGIWVADHMDKAKQLFDWNGEPFANFTAEEQERVAQVKADEKKDRQVFSNAAKALTLKGLANIADSDANYREVRSGITGELTAKNVIDLILNGTKTFSSDDDGQLVEVTNKFGFAKADSKVVQQWTAEANDWLDKQKFAERRALAVEIANSFSQQYEACEAEFKRLMTPPVDLDKLKTMSPVEVRKAVGANLTYETNDQLRKRVEDIRERKRLRSMSKEELKAAINATRSGQSNVEQLPDTWNGQPINSAFIKNLIGQLNPDGSKNQEAAKLFKFMVGKYGHDQINRRLNS